MPASAAASGTGEGAKGEKYEDAMGTMAAQQSNYDVIHGLMKFSGEDKTYSSSKWAQDLEDNAEIFGWTAQQKLIIARRTLAGTAELWLRSEKVFKTYEELKTALQKEFPEQVNCKEMHELMAGRKKRRDESFYQYMLTMKELGKRAKFPDYVAIQYIVDGISDYETNKAVLYGVTSYAVLKEKLSIYEKMKAKKKPVIMEESTNKMSFRKTEASKIKRCYKCGESDHLANACSKGIKCYRCNEYGHIGTQCRKQQSRDSRVEAVRTNQSLFGAKLAKTTNDSEERVTSFRSNIEEPMTATLGEAQTHLEQTCHSCQNASFDMRNVNNRKPIVSLIIKDLRVNSLVDSGSDVNLMSEKFCALLGMNCQHENVTITGLGQTQVRSQGKIVTGITIDGQFYKDITFHIVSWAVMPYDVIIGQEMLQNFTVIMNEGRVLLLSNKNDEWMSRINDVIGCNVVVLDHVMDTALKEEVLQCVENYKPCQTKEAPVELKIILKDDIPIAQRPRRLSLKEQQIVEYQIKEWLENNIIRVSYSEYSSPLVLVPKKDGTVRVCVDYRSLNSKMVKDEFPLPVMEDLIDKLVSAKV